MLLDTSGLLCLLHKSEPFHAEACAAYQSATIRLTHCFVLAEFIALVTARGLPRQEAITFVADLLTNPDIETVWVDEPLAGKALTLLMARRDKSHSLCDAVSFVLMRENNLSDALTTDHHFDQEGFRRLLG
ncbi:MAG: PIN domain-containing protein [Planctomycetota bacterium]|nr:PIN domain-containing protein [Planctomycetota bacterium]